jgi:Tfp pilus assembly protein PilZ
MRERSTTRHVPIQPVSVAIESQPRGTAYGVVADISEGGACVWTDAPLAIGQSLDLALTFPPEPQPVAAHGRVVWSAGPPAVSSPRCGLQWATAESPEARERLRRLIAASV